MTMTAETASFLRDLFWGGGEFKQGMVDDIWEDLWHGETPRVDPHYPGILNDIAYEIKAVILATEKQDAIETATHLHRLSVLAVAMQLQMVVVGKEGFDD